MVTNETTTPSNVKTIYIAHLAATIDTQSYSNEQMAQAADGLLTSALAIFQASDGLTDEQEGALLLLQQAQVLTQALQEQLEREEAKQ